MESNLDRGRTPRGPLDRQVVVGTVEPAPTLQNRRAKKLIVAVHGVGDQYSYATLQSVFNQFCRYYGEPSGIPLGAFHNGQTTFAVPANERVRLEALAFAEVYWAAIPRAVVEEKHTLEEAKRWATTIIERLWMRSMSVVAQDEQWRDDLKLTTQVVHELIETIAITERLCYLADRAGLFTFDLRRVLDNYLGDVQVVTEFKDQREKILKAFLGLMYKAHRECPDADIYIIAHSEGTVVSLLGLLAAFRDPAQASWAHKVRGLMTLGSPIDKHLHFWPELFGSKAPAHVPPHPIAWRNYYDFGDPIGFDLKSASDWLRRPIPGAVHTWADVFEFVHDPKHEHDIGFTRYPFPGKAHVDYWTDHPLFEHFIHTVIEDKNAPASGTASTRNASGPPQTRLTSWLISWVAPYVGVMTLLFIAAYLLTKPYLWAINKDPGSLDVMRYTGAWGLLLSGITVASRLPRLTGSALLKMFAYVLAAALFVGLMWIAPDDAKIRTEVLNSLGISVSAQLWSGTTRVLIGLVIVLAASVITTFHRDSGATPMISIGGVAIGAMLGVVLLRETQVPVTAQGPVWPIFLAAGASLYIWWLSALLFDLVVVWHHYIRTGLINDRIRAMTTGSQSPSPLPERAEAAVV